jgi:hypothetical protein
VPDSGNVLITLEATIEGLSSSMDDIFFGVCDPAVNPFLPVVYAPCLNGSSGGGGTYTTPADVWTVMRLSASFPVEGLTPGATVTYWWWTDYVNAEFTPRFFAPVSGAGDVNAFVMTVEALP